MTNSFSASAVSLLFLLPGVTPAQVEPRPLTDPRQACPTLSVSCPSDYSVGEEITFTAMVSNGSPNAFLVYDWTVSAGRIIRGQGSPSITIDTVGFAGHAYTATVSVSGLGSNCPATASCSLLGCILAPFPMKFDSYGAISRKQEMVRLNVFADQLQNMPGAQGQILFYDGRRGHASEAQRTAIRAKDYLVKARGIEPGRIITVNAGFKEKLTIDLWLVPTGADSPRAEPMFDPGAVKIMRPRNNKSPKRS